MEAVLDDAFPHSFWGSRHNFDQVIGAMRLFMRLGRKEQLPEKAIVNGIRVLDMTWLIHRRDDHPKQHYPPDSVIARNTYYPDQHYHLWESAE